MLIGRAMGIEVGEICRLINVSLIASFEVSLLSTDGYFLAETEVIAEIQKTHKHNIKHLWSDILTSKNPSVAAALPSEFSPTTKLNSFRG